MNDGTDMPESASNGSGDLVWCLLGSDVHQSLRCLCDNSYFQLNGSTAKSRPALVAKYTKLTSQSSLLRSQHHPWSPLMVQSVTSALGPMELMDERKERTYTMQYSSSFSDVVPPDGMGVYAGSPIVVVGDEPIGDESCGRRE